MLSAATSSCVTRSIDDRHHTGEGDAITTPTTRTRKVLCQYAQPGKDGLLDLCTAEVVDPTAEILLCTKHLAAAMRLFRERYAATVGGVR